MGVLGSLVVGSKFSVRADRAGVTSGTLSFFCV